MARTIWPYQGSCGAREGCVGVSSAAEDAFVRRETRKMQEDLQGELIRTVPQLKTPNILVVGRTGVGTCARVTVHQVQTRPR